MDLTILQGAAMVPDGYDSMTSMSHAYNPFVYGDPGVIPWLTATHTISVVTGYRPRARRYWKGRAKQSRSLESAWSIQVFSADLLLYPTRARR